jgi:type II secretory pathway pseudopilin PulG
MLVVLAVFMMLAVMFFFSSNMAITKTKLARVIQDQKSLVNALVSYEGEYFEWPTDAQGLAAVVHSPLSMLSQIPNDPFAKPTTNLRKQQYGYYADLSPTLYRWILVSVGPDGTADLDRALMRMRKQMSRGAAAKPTGERLILMSDKDAHDFIASYTYDPTNGAFSKGNVITVYSQN